MGQLLENIEQIKKTLREGEESQQVEVIRDIYYVENALKDVSENLANELDTQCLVDSDDLKRVGINPTTMKSRIYGNLNRYIRLYMPKGEKGTLTHYSDNTLEGYNLFHNDSYESSLDAKWYKVIGQNESEIDEAKEDRRGQVVDYLLRNPGGTVVDIGRAVWNRDINVLGRNNSSIITIVRTIASALKAGVITRNTAAKPYKYFTTSASAKTIGSVDAPVTTKPKTNTTPTTVPRPVATGKTTVAPADILATLNKNWFYGNWEGGPKYFDLSTNDRGPRTDHGGPPDGDGWMDNRQIEQVRAPYVAKWMPRLKDFQERLKKQGIIIDRLYVDYGEKGHISLGIEVK